MAQRQPRYDLDSSSEHFFTDCSELSNLLLEICSDHPHGKVMTQADACMFIQNNGVCMTALEISLLISNSDWVFFETAKGSLALHHKMAWLEMIFT